MRKEQYYNSIKRFVYRKFDELKVFQSNDGNVLYLHYKNDDDVQIRIYKNTRTVNCYFGFKIKIAKVISLNDADFEILLSRWIEDKFQIKVRNIVSSPF